MTTREQLLITLIVLVREGLITYARYLEIKRELDSRFSGYDLESVLNSLEEEFQI